MGYDQAVRFFNPGKEQYDPDKGQMIREKEDKGTRMCRVNDLTSDRRNELFGRIDVRALSIYHQGNPIDALMVTVDGVDYHVTTSRKLRAKATYIVTEKKI